MTILYDNLGYNRQMLLDLPFREGIGTITQDVAKPHHPVTLVGAPAWNALDSGKMALTLAGFGGGDYAQCLNADCTDLGFTSSDFSIGGWFTWEDTAEDSQILIGRYEVSVGGWELYMTEVGALRYMTLRLHHAGGASARTAGFSLGWAFGTLAHFGVSKIGSSMQFYRNGEPITTVSDVLIDPETTTQDLVIGIRYTKDANLLSGRLPRLVVAGEGLSANDWRAMYRQQRDYA
ncbi:hypothetical protein LCGC14_2059800 [marine sediment metagenome]|uniref:Uncharacterized protein n=1 Tax=marine sediment metagenome TaxID=412755 RepID=A0A0F9HII0_9ZZZZ